jgi:low temperature requirement protein LtrA
LSYVAFRTILVLQYFVAGLANPPMGGMIRHFCFGFTVSIWLWSSSIFVTGPWRFGLWILGLVIDFATPLSAGRYVAKFPPSMSHIPERMGLFTIIVLGESLFAAIGGLSKQESWTVKATSMAVLGLVNAFSLWWMYFETATGEPLSAMKDGRMRRSLVWLYAHLPLAIGITAVGVGLKYAIAKGATVGYLSDGGRWLLCGSMALCLGVMAVMHRLNSNLSHDRRRNLIFHRLVGMGLLLAIGAVGQGLSALMVVGFLALVGLIQILVDVFGQVRAITSGK